MLDRIIRKIFSSRKSTGAFNSIQEGLDYFDSLKNLHLGKRGFVIGNGPSLSYDDLEKLKGEITIASNKIYLAYEKTAWRPCYYSVIDSHVLDNIRDEILKVEIPSFFLSDLRNFFPHKSNFHYLKLLKDGIWENGKYLTYNPGFSDDVKFGIYAGENVTYFNIQLLAHMGCNPIVLTGVDFSFITPSPIRMDKNFGEIYSGSPNPNHFHKDYRPQGETWTQPNLKEMQLSFTYALTHLENRGISLLNASRKSALLDVPKVELEEILNPNNSSQLFNL